MTKLGTAAALALAAATQAHAQSSVTIYGAMDAAVTFARSTQGTSAPGGGTALPALRTTREDSGVGPGSRLGFRGVEDLGGGMSAQFLMEMGIATNTGALGQGGLAFGRQIYVGVGEKDWLLSMGRQYSPVNNAVAAGDASGGIYWGNAYTNIGLGAYESIGGVAGVQQSARVDNSVQLLKRFGPFTAIALYGFGNQLPNGRKSGRVFSPGLQYDGPNFMVSLAGSWTRQQNGAIIATADPETLKSAVISARYDLPFAKVYGGYYTLTGPTQKANLSAAFNTAANAFTWTRMKAPWIGLSVPVGADNVYVTYQHISYQIPSSPSGASNTLMVTYAHNLSKRTAVYVSAAKADNNAFSKTPLTASIVQVPLNGFGADYTALSFGIRHLF